MRVTCATPIGSIAEAEWDRIRRVIIHHRSAAGERRTTDITHWFRASPLGPISDDAGERGPHLDGSDDQLLESVRSGFRFAAAALFLQHLGSAATELRSNHVQFVYDEPAMNAAETALLRGDAGHSFKVVQTFPPSRHPPLPRRPS